jgi:hypothetical protein
MYQLLNSAERLQLLDHLSTSCSDAQLKGKIACFYFNHAGCIREGLNDALVDVMEDDWNGGVTLPISSAHTALLVGDSGSSLGWNNLAFAASRLGSFLLESWHKACLAQAARDMDMVLEDLRALESARLESEIVEEQVNQQREAAA